MKLSVQEIREQHSLDLAASLPAQTFDLAHRNSGASLTRPVEATVHASWIDGEVLVVGRFSTQLGLRCARCLEDYQAPLQGPLEIVATADQAEVDVLEDIRQAIILSLPLKPLCRADCKGLCPQCGKNLNRESCGCSLTSEASPFGVLKKFKTS